jgi:predicted metal-dependent RNase
MSISDNDSFIQRNIVKDVLKAFGWTISNYITHEDVAIIRADFYPSGHVLATSKRAIIVCDGNTEVMFKGTKFSGIKELYEFYGEKAIHNFQDWEFLMVKEWVVKRNSGEFITTFSTLKEMPTEKTCFKRGKKQ